MAAAGSAAVGALRSGVQLRLPEVRTARRLVPYAPPPVFLFGGSGWPSPRPSRERCWPSKRSLQQVEPGSGARPRSLPAARRVWGRSIRAGICPAGLRRGLLLGADEGPGMCRSRRCSPKLPAGAGRQRLQRPLRRAGQRPVEIFLTQTRARSAACTIWSTTPGLPSTRALGASPTRPGAK